MGNEIILHKYGGREGKKIDLDNPHAAFGEAFPRGDGLVAEEVQIMIWVIPSSSGEQ